MSRRFLARVTGVIAAMAMGLVATACGGQELGAFAPRGPAASETTWLFWAMVALGGAVTVAVIVLLARAARGTPPEDAHSERARRRSTRLVLGGGVILPVVVLVPLTVAMLVVAERISPFHDDAAMEVHVIGHQYWWEVRYPGTEAVTANEIRIPAATEVRLRMESADVIHSVWAPELAGKIDMIPGQTTYLDLYADEPGEYLGQCAEFCGLQHARMRFLVIAMEPDEFDAWLDAEAAPAAAPVGDGAQRGAEVFTSVGCAACHTVRGTDAAGTAGPDLTHVASRRTLAAATVANDRGQLAGWIADPQAIKPGNLMPPTPLTGEQLLDLVDYVEGLR